MSSATDNPRRDQILRVARRHFMTEGYTGTGMEAIAHEAGVSTATLYLYFPGKAELFSRVIDETAEEFVRATAAVPLEGTAHDRLTAFALNYARFMSDPFVRSVFSLVVTERRRLKPVANRFIDLGRSEFGATLIRMLEALHADGQLRIHKPSWAAGQLMGMIEHPTCLVPLVTGEQSPGARTAEMIAADAVETFLARYGVPPQG